MLHITLILSNGVVYLDWQSGATVYLDQLTGACHTHTYLITILKYFCNICSLASENGSARQSSYQ